MELEIQILFSLVESKQDCKNKYLELSENLPEVDPKTITLDDLGTKPEKKYSVQRKGETKNFITLDTKKFMENIKMK